MSANEEHTKYQVRTYLDDGDTDFYEYNDEWDFDNLETAKEALESAKLWVKQKDRKYLIGLALTKVINDDDDFEVIEEYWIDNTGDGNESEEETMDELAEWFEEDGECKDCAWRSEYPQSHILYCGGTGCAYIRQKYNAWFDEDGELNWELKK